MYLNARLVCLFCILLIASKLSAQQTQVRFRFLDEKAQPLPSITVSILQVPDTNSRMQMVTDASGVASFRLLQQRPYQLRATVIGYEELIVSFTITRDNPEFEYRMKPVSKSLTGVVVTASRPLIRQEDDKTIVDPENLALASTNAYEVIEKTPGVFVDPDGNIYLSSTTPATVYINGREQKMSAADVATMLKNLPPNAIASIEIMRTPSSRYDASGSGGIVNVVLRKGVRIGLTGSVNAGYQQGKYGNQNLGVTINQNNGSRTSYINLQAGSRKNEERIITNRIFQSDSLLAQNARTLYDNNNFYLGYGLGWQLSKKWDINYDGRLSYNPGNTRSRNISTISGLQTGTVAGRNQTDVFNESSNLNINQGLSGKMKLDSLGSEWTQDLSVTFTPNEVDQNYTSGRGEIDNKLWFLSAQTNYLRKIRGQINVETGLKTTQVWFRNQTGYFRPGINGELKDNNRSGKYNYREQINAAYLQASKTFGPVILKVGSRLEQTIMNGNQQEPKDTSFSINRLDLFPYVYLSRKIMTVAGYDIRAYLVYRRTIVRPAYEYLNPSTRFVDPYLYETGNPSLRPQFSQNYEANISVDERPLVAIGVNNTQDIFTQVVYTADSNGKVSARTYDNLGKNKETYLRLLGVIPPGGRYFFVLGAQYNHNHYEGLYEGKPLSFEKGSWTFFTYHTFRLTPLTQLSMNGFVRFNGQQQFYELSNFGDLRFSVNQQMLKKKLVLTLSAGDVLGTNFNDFTLNQGSVHASGRRSSDTRRFGINLRYQFGIRKKEENSMFNIDPERTN